MHLIEYIFKYYKTYIFFVESVFTVQLDDPKETVLLVLLVLLVQGMAL